MRTNTMRSATGRGLRKPSGRARLVRLGALGLVAVMLTMTSAMLVAGAAAKARLRSQHPPIGQMVDVGGYRMHIACSGSGGPTVLLEAGAGGFGLHWALVQPVVAQRAQVCVYDRAGLGWSDPSPRPRTPTVMAEELATLLARAGIGGPYVLVGHSLGGPIIRQFALAHPQDVVGMVLVDSASEGQVARFPAPIRAAGGQMLPLQLMNLAASAGVLALNPALLPAPAQLPAETAAAVQALIASSGKIISTLRAEMMGAIEDATPPLTSLGEIPLVVLRHDRVDLPARGAVTPEVIQEYEATWAQMQDELAALSPQGRVVVAEDSGHDIHLERPDLVVAAIHEVLSAIP
jgi:pimeloyl-ACP methyl ester carboxylesterase